MNANQKLGAIREIIDLPEDEVVKVVIEPYAPSVDGSFPYSVEVWVQGESGYDLQSSEDLKP